MDSLVCLVTGCSFASGFGVRTARMLMSAGHRVYAGMLDVERDAALEELRAIGARPVQLDVTDEDQVDRVVASILGSEGRVDILVNNAAFGVVGALEDTRPATLERTLAVNVVGPHRLIRRVLPSMRERGGGVIVNIGSINGFIAEPILGAYSTSKAALSMYTEILAYEVGHFGIRVHLVEPGGFATGIHQRVPWEPGGLDPASPYYALQVAFWGDPATWDPDGMPDPDIVAHAIVDAIGDPSAPLFIPVAEDTAELRRRLFGLHELQRREASFAEVVSDLEW